MFATVLWGQGRDWLRGDDGAGFTCTMMTNDNSVLVPGHGEDGLKCGFISYLCQHAVYGSCQVGEGVV